MVAVALILRERPLALPGRHLRGASAAPRCSCTRHLLPTFVAGYQDSFVSGPRIGYAGLRSPRASLAIRRTA